VNLFRVFVNLFRFNRTNWKAVSGCFIAAAVFWLFNALNKNYSTNARFPLQFEFDRKKFVPSQPLPADIYLNVTGNGWSIFRKALGVKLPNIIIPLERPVEIKKIVGSTMPPLLAGQIGTLKINHVVTDTLYISIEPKDSALFRLVVDPSAITFKKGYGRISKVVVLPDSVELIGPKSVLKKLADTLQIVLPERKLSSNYDDDIEIQVTDNRMIKRNPPVVRVLFDVGEVIEEERKVALELINVDPSYSITQELDSISSHIQIPHSRVADFKQMNSIRAVVDLKGFRKGQRKVFPRITGLPDYAQPLRPDSIRIKLY
jgi:hypothetical protein